ncbi:inositol 1,4,5-trisphosphate receptor-interacting protein-like 1 [Calonectris borealis]|uniref:inositol 1,4,5-trisphosphate receptor-interacting protein-like 1 n=1 Tax=Calonectris borealis TaxID=1323832 RepID=UPI003F4C3728
MHFSFLNWSAQTFYETLDPRQRCLADSKLMWINFKAMAVAIVLILAVLATQYGLNHDHQVDVAMTERMQRREQYLHQEMTRLLQEIEHYPEEDALLSVFRQWPFWTAAAALALLAAGLPDMRKVLKELVGDLLGVCRVLCKRTFMPEMHPAFGVGGACEAWSVHENGIAYRLLVFLRPPPGHSFSLEPDTTGQWPARHSSTRVLLECMCSREKLLGDILCFLHHPDDKLPRDQSSDLLRTLCTGSYLDTEKTACWVQKLVRSAWLFLPQSHHCQLTVLPSSQTCRFQLTTTSELNICMEMVLAAQQGSSGAALSLG